MAAYSTSRALIALRKLRTAATKEHSIYPQPRRDFKAGFDAGWFARARWEDENYDRKAAIKEVFAELAKKTPPPVARPIIVGPGCSQVDTASIRPFGAGSLQFRLKKRAKERK